MQINKKYLIIIIILLIVFALTFTFMKNNKKKNNNNNNNNEDNGSYLVRENIKSEYIYGDIKITDIEIFDDGTISKFAAIVTNTSNRDIKINNLKIKFYSKDKDLIMEETLLYEMTLSANSNQIVNIKGDMDLKDTDDIEFEVSYE